VLQRAPKIGKAFKLYIAAQEHVVGATLMQDEDGKEHVMAYVTWHLLDAETRYMFVEKLCLSLYYACQKFRHYILSSTCIVICQHDVVKFMLKKPILSGRLGKWAYSLVEFDLAYEPLKAMREQVVTDFIVDHAVAFEDEVCMVEVAPWKLLFDGSLCSKGWGVSCVLVSSNNIPFDLSFI
jgi:hypothetical protein